MAMLRNLRNMLLNGVSMRHHAMVLGKLADEGTVINSRQFPFSFFSAYDLLSLEMMTGLVEKRNRRILVNAAVKKAKSEG
jgi:hypothetical protein